MADQNAFGSSDFDAGVELLTEVAQDVSKEVPVLKSLVAIVAKRLSEKNMKDLLNEGWRDLNDTQNILINPQYQEALMHANIHAGLLQTWKEYISFIIWIVYTLTYLAAALFVSLWTRTRSCRC